MNPDDVVLNEDDDVEDVNPEDAVDNVEDDIPSENTNPTSAPNNEAPDGR
jgi:hypothetical protein